MCSQSDKLKNSDEKVKTLTESLDKFKDIDVDKLNGDIEDLKKQLNDKDKELAEKLADRDFMDVLKDSIHAAKGKDVDKIIRLLDVDTLKTSKNQKDDIAAAIKEMTENDVTKGMFGTTEPKKEGKLDVIGGILGGSDNTTDAQMRAVMGLPPVQKGE